MYPHADNTKVRDVRIRKRRNVGDRVWPGNNENRSRYARALLRPNWANANVNRRRDIVCKCVIGVYIYVCSCTWLIWFKFFERLSVCSYRRGAVEK